jgi:hypothetical protein
MIITCAMPWRISVTEWPRIGREYGGLGSSARHLVPGNCDNENVTGTYRSELVALYASICRC